MRPSPEEPRLDDADLIVDQSSAPDSFRFPSGRGRLLVGLIGLVAFGVVGYLVSAAGDDRPTPRRIAQGGDLGSVDDAGSLREQLAPELAPGSEAGGEPVERPRCADSSSALPADSAALVYAAELTYEGTPAVVLGYRMRADNLQRLLLVMATDDCRVLVTQSF